MGYFEEMEWQLGGRLKSVLIVILSATLVFLYAGVRERSQEDGHAGAALESPMVVQTWGPGVYAEGYDNPIDRYFLRIEEQLPENMYDRWQQLYLDAWEMELAHAYELMAEEMPDNFFAEGGYGQRARQAFEEFVETQGYLEGYYAGGIPGERGIMVNARLELARAQAMRIYEQICEKEAKGEMEDLYLFQR